mgnify:CR=1 FL=1|tara:strand:+ start:679 stop:1434 length:756 start_codon:yes stop_codon:yes gene_type:complete
MLVSVIIPAYNEEKAVRQVIMDVADQTAPLLTMGHSLEILLIANSCSDNTIPWALETADIYRPSSYDVSVTSAYNPFPEIKVIEEERKGYGWAHRRGMAESKGDIIITLDCDNTYPAKDIPEIVSEFDRSCKECGETVDAVFTNRLTDDAHMGTVSRVGNFMLSLAIRMLHGQVPRDSQSGMWAYRREMMTVLFAGVGSGMELSEQTKLRVAGESRCWKDRDIEYYERVGESKLNPVRDGLRCLWRVVTTV